MPATLINMQFSNIFAPIQPETLTIQNPQSTEMIESKLKAGKTFSKCAKTFFVPFFHFLFTYSKLLFSKYVFKIFWEPLTNVHGAIKVFLGGQFILKQFLKLLSNRDFGKVEHFALYHFSLVEYWEFVLISAINASFARLLSFDTKDFEQCYENALLIW